MSHPKTIKDKKFVKMTSVLNKSSEDEIRTLAYQIYESSGRQGNSAEQDWLQAERELLTRRN